ncbi:AAA family ATPase [Crenobacter sp. SG2305]|uniref:ATP-binding protein n=1 Tax=Crenobacter oryzisoli TaxID=3056844 RepID=UPI0025AA9649|nr:ATP-binding protein [Crenobacter sp. SG2305]MDN0082485.1 AAA family ATPase [Crenobacter sp. SG2305]
MSRNQREMDEVMDGMFHGIHSKFGVVSTLLGAVSLYIWILVVYGGATGQLHMQSAKVFGEMYAPNGLGYLFAIVVYACIAITIATSGFVRGWPRGLMAMFSGILGSVFGFALVPLVGFASIMTIIHGHGSWFQWLLAVPGLLWVAYGVQGWICGREGERVMRPIGDSDQGKEAALPTFPAAQPKLTFADIVGMDDLKARLLEAGNEVRQKRDSRNGILLSGEPGNGKTMFAEALAGELGLRFLSVSYGDVASRWVNQTTEQLMALFVAARRQAPCVLFIDEIDSLISSRDSQGSSEEGPRITNTFLTEIVKLRGSGVVFIGATNFLDKLDAAAIREGRFDYKIEVSSPDLPARVAILSKALAKAGGRAVQIESGAVERVAKRWSGFSASRIDAVGKEAGKAAVKKSGRITFDGLMAAMRTVQGRAGKMADGVPTLAEMSLTAGMRDPLNKLAIRMERIVELEELGGTVPRGVLFHGPAGTGKTLAAQALAKTAGWAFLAVQGMDLIRDQAKIEAIFKEAADIRPCVLFIDEADDLLAHREGSPYAAVTNKFLSVMDGAGGKTPDVMVIAATNFPERLDEAALRGGRFTEKVGFETADDSQASALVSSWLSSLKLGLANDVNQASLVRLMVGQSPANIRATLQHVVDDVAARSLTGGSATIGMADIKAALEMVI